MTFKRVIAAVLIGYLVLCTGLVAGSGIFTNMSSASGELIIPLAGETTLQAAAEENPKAEDESSRFEEISARGGQAETIELGSAEQGSPFQFGLELTSKGAGVAYAKLRDFDNLDRENPKPLTILSPVADSIISMANGLFIFMDQAKYVDLGRLNWKSSELVTQRDGSQEVQFEAVISAGTADAVKLTKIYTVRPDSHHFDCALTIENLTKNELKTKFTIQGPAGLGKEGARADMRKVSAAFLDSEGDIDPVRIDIKKLFKQGQTSLTHEEAGRNFIWAATANKYFVAIMRPVPSENENHPAWIRDKNANHINPDGLTDSGDENVSFDVRSAPVLLSAAGEDQSSQTFEFQVYLGPKDKSLFEKNELYRQLGFVKAIDFRACCGDIFTPISFFLLATMKWMHGFLFNYGIVIIVLVFMVRLLMHPVTKKSQISMMKMQKLAPMTEEIKKKYAGNKAEMNKQMMALYKKQGASPILGCLPMALQMPVWIALYSAIYASVDLRGAAFLPFWITNLAAPDALFTFTAVKLPLAGTLDSFNLLPILLGAAMFMQQKLMPHASTSTNTQAAQQQKMMMYMMPIMMLVFLYKAPSGLNLYIMASTFAGVLEQIIIRKHIREKEAAEAQGLVAVTSKTGGKVKKKKPKPFYKNQI